MSDCAAKVRQFVKRSPLGPVVRSSRALVIRRALVNARLVRDPVRYIAFESGSRGRVAEHRLTELPVTVALRHRSRDTDVLGEMPWAYRPPPSIALPASGTVLDIGANIGLFALWTLARYPGISVVSYEPDPNNLPLLARNRALGGFGERWTTRAVAVGNRNGEARFASGGYADSRVNESGDVVIPLVDIFEQPHGQLMKIDIEGSEWDVLRDHRLPALPADVVVMEWHRHAIDGTTGDAAEAVGLLEKAGFDIAASQFDRGRDHGLVWAARR